MRLRLFFFLVIFLVLLQQPAGPCAPAPPQGARVSILDESALIVWDSEKKIEHFIRRATFQSDAADFGFLVPTPEKPELAEAPNEVFQLEHLMAPKTVYSDRKGIRFMFGFAELFLMGSGVTSGPPDRNFPTSVRVIQATQVAGYDAVVLEADDSEALNTWLNEHGYPSSPELQQWFEPYVAMKWKITAFKISGDRASSNVSTSAVRMSFHTERPFFPYREPKMDTMDQDRTLQILMLSNERMEGKLGENFSENWPGITEWADRLESGDTASLLNQLKISINQKQLWLIDFEDKSSPRPGHMDLYFRTATDQAPVVPPPVIIENDVRIPIPLDLLFIIGVITVWIFKRKRSSARKA